MIVRLYKLALRILLAAAVALLAMSLDAGVALAHPQIVSIEPAPDAQLDRAPTTVAVTFNEPIETLSTLGLYDVRGVAVGTGGGRDPGDPTRLTLTLPPLEPGLYTAVWTAAGSDGHVVRGNFAFTVAGVPAQAGTPVPGATAVPAAPATPAVPLVAPTPAETSFPTAQSLVRWALLLGVTGAVGGWAFWLWVALPALGAATVPAAAVGRWRGWSAGLLLLAMVAAPLLLALYVREIAGRLDPAALMAAVGTRQGMLMLARLALAATLLALTLTTRDGAALARRAPFALALGAALLLAMSLGGHAGASAQPLFPVAFTWLHLAATSLWVGGLLLFALSLGPLQQTRPGAERPALLAALMGRFSRLALLSVAVLTVSGAAAALRELRAPAELWQTAYGRALSLKLLFFGGMLAFGAYHLLLMGPNLRADAASGRGAGPSPWPGRLVGSLRAEYGVALLVLAAAGALTSLAPPAGDMGTAQAAAPAPQIILVPTVTPGPTRTPVPSRAFDESQTAGDLTVRLAIAPASLGENRFQVTVTDAAGQPVETQIVRLTFAMQEMDMGENVLEAPPSGGAAFVVTGSPLSMVGQWQVTVLVRRAGLEDVSVDFVVPVGE